MRGTIVLLNGAPRSGKSSIAAALQDTPDALWINLGVDAYMRMTPQHLQPGIGLRPGRERPDLEPHVQCMYHALYASIAAHSRMGIHVVADVGHHDDYATLDGLYASCLHIIEGLPYVTVGVHCALDEIIRRRQTTDYPALDADGNVLPAIVRWQECIHRDKTYDVTVDTACMSADACAQLIRKHLLSLS